MMRVMIDEYEQWLNDDFRGIPYNLEEKFPSATAHNTNCACAVLVLNPGLTMRGRNTTV